MTLDLSKIDTEVNSHSHSNAYHSSYCTMASCSVLSLAEALRIALEGLEAARHNLLLEVSDRYVARGLSGLAAEAIAKALEAL